MESMVVPVQTFTCPTMQRVITAFAEKHGFDLWRGDGSGMIFHLGAYQDFEVSAIYDNVVWVGFNGEANGDMYGDPRIGFMRTTIGWVPYFIEQIVGTRYCAEAQKEDEDGVVDFTVTDMRELRDIREYAEELALELEGRYRNVTPELLLG